MIRESRSSIFAAAIWLFESRKGEKFGKPNIGVEIEIENRKLSTYVNVPSYL